MLACVDGADRVGLVVETEDELEHGQSLSWMPARRDAPHLDGMTSPPTAKKPGPNAHLGPSAHPAPGAHPGLSTHRPPMDLPKAIDLIGSPVSDRSELPDQLGKFISETMAAHAAVVLAKTQAAAARAEGRELNRKLVRLEDEMDDRGRELQHMDDELASANRELIRLDKELAVSEARSGEIRDQLDLVRHERRHLLDRLEAVERDRSQLDAAIGWFGRQRLKRRSVL